MADNTVLNPGFGGDVYAADDVSGVKYQRVKLDFGGDGAASPVVDTMPVAEAGQELWACSFSSVGTSVLAPEFIAPIVDAGVGYSQASGSLLITTGTTANEEFLTRSVDSWSGSMRLRFGFTASQRIVNQNLMLTLADLIGEGLAYNIVSATQVDVTKTAHGFTAQNIGQSMFLGGITGADGVPGRYAIESIPGLNTIRFTVASWPASGTGTLTLFGHSHAKVLYQGTSATAAAFDTARRGWASGDTTIANLTTASPGHIVAIELTGREAFVFDKLRASATAPTLASRGSRDEGIPDENVNLHLFLWSYNGTTAPATTTTWTLSFASVEQFANKAVYLQGVRSNGLANPLAVAGSVTSSLSASTLRAGFFASAGIWYDDSSTNLGSSATFTGTSRDATVTATATAFANAATYAGEVRALAESDVTGTLWLEASRDNSNWRRVRSVPTVAITGGGFAAELEYKPAWRYWRIGYTNGAGAQARFTLGTIATAN